MPSKTRLSYLPSKTRDSSRSHTYECTWCRPLRLGEYTSRVSSIFAELSVKLGADVGLTQYSDRPLKVDCTAFSEEGLDSSALFRPLLVDRIWMQTAESRLHPIGKPRRAS